MIERQRQQPPGVSPLGTILLREQLVARFGSTLILEGFGKADLETIAKKYPTVVLQIGGSVWNRIVQKKWHPVNPLQFASYFRKSAPKSLSGDLDAARSRSDSRHLLRKRLDLEK
jgi:hypothetical protein